MKVSEYIIKFLAERGVKHVFMLAGGGAMHLNHSLSQEPSITPVCCLHEQGAAIAAEAYAKATGGLGVCMVTTGPGGTNCVTGVASAWTDSVPVLFLSGQVKCADLKGQTGVRTWGLRDTLRQRGPQEIGIVDIVSTISKYAVTITTPNSVRWHLEKAVYLAFDGRPGPVWLDIPLDIQASEFDDRQAWFNPGPFVLYRAKTLKLEVSEIIEKLNKSERPLLFAGNGIRCANRTVEFQLLRDVLNIPAIATWPAYDLVPDRIGSVGTMASRAGNFAIQNCDFMLALGVRFDSSIVAYDLPNFARNAWKAAVDVDEAEVDKYRSIFQQPVLADCRLFIDEFLRQTKSVKPVDRIVWKAHIKMWQEKYPVVTPEHREPRGLVSVFNFSEILSSELKPDDQLVVGSSGIAIEMFLMSFTGPQRPYLGSGLGSMGFCVPYCLGVALAHRNKRVVCVTSDGSVWMNFQELEVIRRLNLNVVIFVLDNDGFGSIRASQRNYFGKAAIGCDTETGLSLPKVRDVGSAFGITSTNIHGQAHLQQSLQYVLSVRGPRICNVFCLPNEDRVPCLKSQLREDGTMVSPSLENLYPFLSDQELKSNMITVEGK